MVDLGDFKTKYEIKDFFFKCLKKKSDPPGAVSGGGDHQQRGPGPHHRRLPQTPQLHPQGLRLCY